jgi:glutaredoxin
VSEVPETFRTKVQLVDLNLSPEKRKSSFFVPIYDLSKPNRDGAYVGQWVSRKSLEKALIDSKPKVVLPEYHVVTLYETDWCGYCKKAKAFLKEKNIPFEAFNIENDAQAAQKLQQKASAQKFPMGGVPVLEINGKLISGFNPDQILSMARIQGK